MRPVAEQTILVTGATDGLGRRVALDIAEQGATLILHGRSRERGEEVLAEARRSSDHEGSRLALADLASLDEVRRLASEVEQGVGQLDVLVNNAGLGGTPDRRTSEDGHELVFAVNYLAGFLLTALLMPLLRRSAPARIVNVASIGQQAIDFDDVMLERGYSQFGAYSQSKLAQILFTIELSERLGADAGVTVNALHPATLMDTTMVRESYGRARSSVEEGARATERLATDQSLDDVTGRYYDGLEESAADPQAYDRESRRRLWALSEQLADVHFET